MVETSYGRMMEFFPPVAGEPDLARFKDIFNKVSAATPEVNMYQPLADALNMYATKFANPDAAIPNAPDADAHMADGKFVVVVTDSLPDNTDSAKRKVDLGMYRTGSVPASEKRTDWSQIELSIEVKKEDKLDAFASDSLPAQEFLGQIMTYTDLVFKRQQRTHYYTLAIFGKQARIVRWDRSGYVFTQKFDYTTEPEKLALFVWRLSHATPAVQGHDHTATRIVDEASAEYKLLNSYTETATGDSAKPAAADTAQASAGETAQSAAGAAAGDSAKPTPIDYARELFVNSLRNPKKWPWWKLTIPNVDPKEPPHVYLVGEPTFYAREIVGRGTRGYVALDYTDPTNPGPFVYLKDCWRVVHPRSEQEGAILTYLNSKGVGYIPTMLCHGDIGEKTEMARDVWKEVHGAEKECPLKNHRHYRLVVKEVGKPLKMFKNGRELVWVVMNAVMAHRDAYTNAHTIHRDLSVGNILILPDPDEPNFGCHGLLTDWELSKRTDEKDLEPRHPDRTGTWQFMSVNALQESRKQIVIPDEMESVFHILLYCSIRYLPHTCSNVGEFMQRYFDDGVPLDNNPKEFTCGLLKEKVITRGMLLSHDHNPIVFLLERPSPANVPAHPSPPPANPSSSSSTDPSSSPSPSGSRPSTPTPPSRSEPKKLLAPQEEYPDDRRHPMDRVLRHMLPLFEALYRLQDHTMKQIKKGSEKKLETIDENQELQKHARARDFFLKKPPRPVDREDPTPLSRPDMAMLKAFEENALKLREHTEIGTILAEAAFDEEQWPTCDKTEDQLLSTYKPGKENTQTAKTSKRSAVDTTEERKHKKPRSTVSQT